jgi:hypothetical protein
MTANRDPLIAAAYCLATVAACFAAGWSVAGLIYDRLRRTR